MWLVLPSTDKSWNLFCLMRNVMQLKGNKLATVFKAQLKFKSKVFSLCSKNVIKK